MTLDVFDNQNGCQTSDKHEMLCSLRRQIGFRNKSSKRRRCERE